MTDNARIEIAHFDGGDVLGEGPYWLPGRQRLYWLDIMEHELHSLEPASGAHRMVKTEEKVHAISLARYPWFVCTVHKHGLAWLNVEDGTLVPHVDPAPDHKAYLLNDGRCDSRGHFWFGSIDKQDQPTGSLFRLDEAGHVTTEYHGLRASNGIAFAPGGRQMYLADTHTGIFAFDLDSNGEIAGPPRMIYEARKGSSDGLPDGMTIDDQGCLWVAMVHGGRLLRLTPSGAIDRTIMMPCTNVMSCTFAGPNFDTLYVTSGRLGQSAERLAAEPSLGALFAVRVGHRGFAEVPFGGFPPGQSIPG
jgi:sugar lactone lactonase YvrE